MRTNSFSPSLLEILERCADMASLPSDASIDPTILLADARAISAAKAPGSGVREAADRNSAAKVARPPLRTWPSRHIVFMT